MTFTWRDQYETHRASARQFDERRKDFVERGRLARRGKRFIDANRYRILAQEYRQKAVDERTKAAEIKRLYLTKP